MKNVVVPRITAVLAILVLAAAPLAAQEHEHHGEHHAGGMASAEGLPDGWLMRFDRAGAAADQADLVVMEPGWHIKTGRAGSGIYWMPGTDADGEYTLVAKFHLFSPRPHAESFGVFLGGEDLGDDDQEYLYFLVRQTGEYLIKRRMGTETANVVGWTAHEAVPTMEPGAEDPTPYDLAVDVGAETVTFRVNGTPVHSLDRSGLDTDGTVGLRVNHMLDLHVEWLRIEP